MRILTLIVVAVGVLWGGYWFVGSRALERGTAAAFAAARAEGRVADYSALAVEGFPNRFDMTLHGLSLGDDGGGLIWRAPLLRLFALSYRPNRMIVVFPGIQTVEAGGEVLTLGAAKMEANFNLRANAGLTFDSTTLIADALKVASSAGWRLSLRQARVAAAPDPGHAATYRIGVEALDIAPGPILRAAIDPAAKLPAVAERLHLDGDIAFSAALDRHAATTHPRPTSFSLRASRAVWGGVTLAASGGVTFDAGGAPAGQIMLMVTDWEALVDAAEAAGWVREDLVTPLRRTLAELAKTSPGKDTVEMPLVFAGGQMRLGPIPLGPAPRLR